VTTRSATPLTISAEPGLPFIDTERVVNAPRELVFRCWTEPDLLVQWLGPRRLTMRIDAFEAREGGRYRYVHVEPDGTEYGFHGVFHGPVTVDNLVQTFEFERAPGHVSLDRLTLEDLGDGRTRIRGHSVYESVEARDAMAASGMESGMSEGYEQLDELLARLQAH
jgi:uncharacterized protein YndB with AHSA1/START domain